jgi:hypothetical protein
MVSPRAIIIEPAESGATAPKVRIGEWQSAARGLSATSTSHHVVSTTHAGRHVDPAAAAYLAPEFDGDFEGTEGIDSSGSARRRI